MVKNVSPWLTLVASFLETPHIQCDAGVVVDDKQIEVVEHFKLYIYWIAEIS